MRTGLPLFLIIAIGLCWSTPSVLASPVIPADRSSAVIMAYGRIDDHTTPQISLPLSDFEAHIVELQTGPYHVMSLPDILKALHNQEPLPARTVALTFDGGDPSFMLYAYPKLEAAKIPYTLFIAPGITQENTNNVLGWKDLRKIAKSPYATIGVHPMEYTRRLLNASDTLIRHSLNGAKSIVRKELDLEPTLFAYPFGEYSQAYKDLVQKAGFDAAFGQGSGAISPESDFYALSRFTMTEGFGDLERFQLTANALPLPVTDIEPENPYLDTATPFIGFTLEKNLPAADLECFVSGQERPTIENLGDGRVEIRLQEPLSNERTRINCTMIGPHVSKEDVQPWRWFGMMMTLRENAQ